MSGGKFRRAARVDDNQNDIVEALEAIPGVKVEKNHDDIFCGFLGVNYWFEIKNPDLANKKGEIYPSKIKKGQHKLNKEWTGQYDIVHNIDQILEIMGINKDIQR